MKIILLTPKKIILIIIVAIAVIAIGFVVMYAQTSANTQWSFKVKGCAKSGQAIGYRISETEFDKTKCCIGLKPQFYLSGSTVCEYPWVFPGYQGLEY